MGLRTLEWFRHNEGHQGPEQWIARVKTPGAVATYKYMRFAHVNIWSWELGNKQRLRKGEVPVLFQISSLGYDPHWFDSVEAAKLHVEATFALYND